MKRATEPPMHLSPLARRETGKGKPGPRSTLNKQPRTRYHAQQATKGDTMPVGNLRPFLIKRTDPIGYDEYDAHLVMAESGEEAMAELKVEFFGRREVQPEWADGNPPAGSIQIIDVSNMPGVVISSFNAG